jgi:hypothetical protein
VAAALFKWWPSDERAIRRELDAIADALTVPPTDTELSRVARLAELRNHFAPDVRVRFGRQDVVSRDALMGLASRWAPPPGGIFVEFVDPTIAVGDDATAQVYLTVKVSTIDARTTEPTVDAREADIGFAKIEGDWLVTSVEARETLERPDGR